MVGSIDSTSNLVNMISMGFQQNSSGSQVFSSIEADGEDPLKVFESVDSDNDGTISESEFDTLNQGISAVTGSELSSFLDYDTDEDGVLNASELRSVMDEAGFQPPPPPPGQVISAYENQQGESVSTAPADDTLLTQLLDYLDTQAGDLDITA